MEVITIHTEAYQNLISKIETLAESLKQSQKKEKEEKLYDNDHVQKLLNVSSRTLQSYRDRNLIDFFQIGNKIYYKSEHIQAFLSAHHIKSRK